MSAYRFFKPNSIVEIGSAEVTSIHRPSRRTSFCSVYNSVEDVTSARVCSEVDQRQSIGRLSFTAAQHTHTNGSRAETREASRRHISRVKELDLNNEKLRYFLKCRGDDAVEGEQEAL